MKQVSSFVKTGLEEKVLNLLEENKFLRADIDVLQREANKMAKTIGKLRDEVLMLKWRLK